MSKLWVPAVLALTAGMLAAPAVAEPLGPHAAACERGGSTAVLVHVVGFKAREGMVRVQLYGGDPSTYFDKGHWLERIDLNVPPRGPVDVCLPVPRVGTYAISVRHDVDGNGKTSRADGGGMSGNPHLSLTDLMFKRKPSPEAVAVRVGGGIVPVPVVLNYLDGLSFHPIATIVER